MRQVTELDFRMPEFRDAKVEDYEFRNDGKLVRKDRWERAIVSIRFLVGIDGREFEIPDVVEAVRELAAQSDGWFSVDEESVDSDDFPEAGLTVEVRLVDDSVLKNAAYVSAEKRWYWNGAVVPLPVAAWRPQRASKQVTDSTPGVD